MARCRMSTGGQFFVLHVHLQTADDHLVLLVLLEADSVGPELALLAVPADCTHSQGVHAQSLSPYKV
jgi:hypothetical protein